MKDTRAKIYEDRLIAVSLILFLIFTGRTLALECPVSLNTSNPQLNPDISGDRIVWQDDGSRDIFMFNLSDGQETRLTSDAEGESNPLISGSLVVWMEGHSIFLYNLSTQDITTLTTNGNSPALSGSQIIWVNITEDASAPNISVYDADTGTQTDIVTEPSDRPNGGQPAIDGEEIVWVNGTDLTTLYSKDILSGAEELVNESDCGNTSSDTGDASTTRRFRVTGLYGPVTGMIPGIGISFFAIPSIRMESHSPEMMVSIPTLPSMGTGSSGPMERISSLTMSLTILLPR